MKKEILWDVIVIGGGPAGMMAAGRASERGLRVLLLEKNATLGKKLLITGGGRCNITNNKPDLHIMLAQYKKSNKFLFSAFAQFGVAETIDFFQSRGMKIKEETEGRMFPVSNNAQSVSDVLLQYMKDGGVNVRTNAAVANIILNKRTQKIVITLVDASTICARSCIVASGGLSHPETGSCGDGFLWLKKFGHTIIKNDMALVPIALSDPWIKKLAGVTLQNIKLTTFKNSVKQKTYKGKLLFTHFGISGPTVLNMSHDVSELLYDNSEPVIIMLDLFPNEDVGTLRKKLQIHLDEQSNKKIKNALSTFIPTRLVNTILALSHVDFETPCHSMRTADRKKIVSFVKEIPLTVTGLLGKEKAIVSSGGVTLSEINFKTMQSRVVPQLYVVGDMLDIDRPSGGYSLQLCWTTGYVAGNNCDDKK